MFIHPFAYFKLAIMSSFLISPATVQTERSPTDKLEFAGGKKFLDKLPRKMQMFIGSASNTVNTLTFDTVEKTFGTLATTSALGEKPTWLTLDSSQTILISTSSVPNYLGKDNTGGIISARVASDGTLTKISSAISSAEPVSSEFSPDGKLLAVACYISGALTTYTIDSNGVLSPEPVQTFHFERPGPATPLQKAAYAHQARFDPTGRLLLVADLGADRIHIFSLEHDGTLKQRKDFHVKPASGPRHMDFYTLPSGVVQVYVVCELSNEILVLEINFGSDVGLKLKQTIKTLTKSLETPTMFASEVVITPDGRFVYAGNRQKDPAGKVSDNTISVFLRDLENGILTLSGAFPTGGKVPRFIGLSPDKAASFLVVTNQDNDLVTMHHRDKSSGSLTLVAQVTQKNPTVALFKM